MFFVVGCSFEESVLPDEELCISYIEHETLMESTERVTALLDMDFQQQGQEEEDDADVSKHQDEKNGTNENDNKHDNDDDQGDNDDDDDECDDDGPNYPIIDDDIQQELMNMIPTERLKDITELLQQSTTSSNNWFKCDTHRLKILLALTHDGLGQFDKALSCWKECVDFAETYFPFLDENCIAIYVQYALCARALSLSSMTTTTAETTEDNNMALAKKYANLALKKHSLLYGGGVLRFRKRYEQELALQLRKEEEEDENNSKRKKTNSKSWMMVASSKKLSGPIAMNDLWPLSLDG
uniref:Uncharacterized protein n=1 Tax=Ditylum brightwellii TaxID=49249 RepID=A0A7S4W3F9_9STRA|mmetsp:Transcript_69867/g.103913  ORF Transcript_69867/g.103913 Transcript_69867/m.103913 type:complete len:297 (+) Transcript_69867:354-1244(+)